MCQLSTKASPDSCNWNKGLSMRAVLSPYHAFIDRLHCHAVDWVPGGSNPTKSSKGRVRAHAMKSIRELRQERGWSQNDLATRLQVHPQAVYLWESGRRIPHVLTLRKLGQLFGLSSDEITLIEKQPGGARE